MIWAVDVNFGQWKLWWGAVHRGVCSVLVVCFQGNMIPLVAYRSEIRRLEKNGNCNAEDVFDDQTGCEGLAFQISVCRWGCCWRIGGSLEILDVEGDINSADIYVVHRFC